MKLSNSPAGIFVINWNIPVANLSVSVALPSGSTAFKEASLATNGAEVAMTNVGDRLVLNIPGLLDATVAVVCADPKTRVASIRCERKRVHSVQWLDNIVYNHISEIYHGRLHVTN